jgi:IS30 family transposase
MMPYEHLNLCDRKVIKKMLSKDKSIREIARYIDRDPRTISREIKRNKLKYWYHPSHAQEQYDNRRKNSKKRILDINISLRDHIIDNLKDGYAPDAISGRLKLTHKNQPNMHISHESIYSWIYLKALDGDDLYKYLPQGIKKRQKKINKKKSRFLIPNRVSIHTRPHSIETRRWQGHWEGDTITGKGHQGYIVTLVERKTFFLVAGLMNNKEPDTCNKAILEAYGNIPNDAIKSITFDNGSEFYHHKNLQDALECKIYFADPYSAWQRGVNEHTNGLLRRYFPKNMGFKDLTQNDVDKVVFKLNNMPRKSLGYRTPYEAFYKLNVALQT